MADTHEQRMRRSVSYRDDWQKARIAELEALLREADGNVVWEIAYPTKGREFQRRVEAALGIGQKAEE
jgi:hypothetical protein